MKAQHIMSDSGHGQPQQSSLDPEAAWPQMRAALRERLGETAFRRWLEPVTGSVEIAGGKEAAALILSLPTRFMRDWVEAHYGDPISVLWKRFAGQGRVEFAVVSPLNKSTASKETSSHPAQSLPAAAA